MYLTEQHAIDRKDPRFAVIDAAAFASKNLYNAALYEMRQAFFNEGIYLKYEEIQRRMQSHEAYKALPAKVSQQILMQLANNWEAFREAKRAYKENPSKFIGRPKLPRYKHKTEGRNILIIVEVIYDKEPMQASVNPVYYAGIDIGTNNLAALTSNKPHFQAVVVNGCPIKSVNQFYNKRRAALQEKLGRTDTTKRMERMTNRRNRRIDHYMHTASKRIIDFLVQEGIGTLVIGKNDAWKQEANLGKRTNQNFVQVPHARFISMLTYKAELIGIRVLITEESYTSKASFLDRDPLPVRNTGNEKHTFSGKRVKRGLYRASNGRYINADINGAGNIIRKVAPDAFGSEGVEDLVVHPVRITLAK